jgi:hypothetical protein
MPASTPKARFEPVRLKSGKAWYVRVTPPHGRETQIEGFTRKAEAAAWVEHESAEWLKTYAGGKYARASGFLHDDGPARLSLAPSPRG